MQISRLLCAHPVDSEQWHCQEHFDGTVKSTFGLERLLSSKGNRKRSQGLKSDEYDELVICATVSVSSKS